MPYYTALVSLLTVMFLFFLATRVAAARKKFNVRPPSTTGNVDFERVFRVHMNTLEWVPIFLVSLWLCAIHLSDVAAAALGIVWIGGRMLYLIGYSEAVEQRRNGFLIQSIACASLFVGALAGILTR